MVRSVWVQLAVLGLCACANPSAQECDATHAGSVFSASACLRGGGFEARIAQIRAETRMKIEQASLSRQRGQELAVRAEALSQDRAALRRELDSTETELAMLRVQLGGIKAKNAEEEARLQALKEQLGAMEQQLAAAQAELPASAADIARLEADIERKRMAIAAVVEEMQRGQ